MMLDVVEAMREFGDVGYSCFEIPEFVGDESLLVFYNHDLVKDDVVIGSLERMPGAIEAACESASWDDGLMRVECSELFCQGHDARFLTVSTIDISGEWPCVIEGIVAIDDETRNAFSYADMFASMREELEYQGII